MKTIDKTKRVVLAIGSLTLMVGLIGLIDSTSLMEQFFPIYTGLTLMGTTLLHEEVPNTTKL